MDYWAKKELVLLVNLYATNSNDKKSIIKKNFHVISSGLVETYLLLANDVYFIIKNKTCASPKSKFDIAKYLLSEESLEEWTTTKITVVNKLFIDEVVFDESSSDEEADKNKVKETKPHTI